MKRMVKGLMIAMMCGMLVVGTADAQGRGNRHPGAGRPGAGQQGPGRPGPGHNPGGPGFGQTGPNRPNPGPPPGGPNRPNPGPPPGGPGHGHGHGPGFGPGPGPISPGPGPGYRPGGPIAPPPMRPYRPVYSGWYRPVPPPVAWRPGPVVPSFGTILGIALGSTLDYTLNSLYNSGYYIDGYANKMVYLRDVNELGYFWPDAALYYNTAGGLAGSQYYYSTAYNDPARYNSVYNALAMRYGPPVVSNGASLTWYGNNGLYITLNYEARPAMGGGNRFFTILTFGN